MHSAWFKSTFVRLLKFPKIKEVRSNFCGEPILQNGWIIWSPFLYSNFKSFRDLNSSSFIRIQCILHHSEVPFPNFWNFDKLKRGGTNFWGQPILQNIWIIWSFLLYLNFKSYKDPNSSSFTRFQCILHDSGVLFSQFSNFKKLKRGDLIWGGTNPAEQLNYLALLSVFQFSKFQETKFLVIH